MKKVPAKFFRQPTLEVAHKLIGKSLVFQQNNQQLSGIITETEAYTQEDPACHAYLGKKTPRNNAMFMPPGTIYIYFIYGMYHCLNFVTEETNRGCAVLIREVIPQDGIQLMHTNRPNQPLKNLTNGPAKLMQAFNIPATLNKTPYNKSPLFVTQPNKQNNYNIKQLPRIGIKQATDKLWRFKLIK